MAFSELEARRIEKAVAAYIERRRPPVHIRPKLDLGFRLSGQSVEIFEIRPRWREPHIKQEFGVAKATYVKRHDYWKIYWLRADLKWHRYSPEPTVDRVEDFCDVVDRDEYCCFFG